MELQLCIFVLTLVTLVSCFSMRKQSTNPTIIWSTDNKLFKSTGDTHKHALVIHVKIGDFLNIVCPRYDTLLDLNNAELQFNSIYMVSKQEYDACELDHPRLLLKCDKPFDNLKYTLYISKYSPVPDAIEFSENRDYYLISTSDGSLNGLNNTSKGTCHTNNMKLVIRVADNKLTLSSSHNHHLSTTRATNQMLKRLTSSIIRSTSTISTTTTRTSSKSTSRRTSTTTSSFKPANDIFILEPSDTSSDYTELLQMITNTNNNSENNNNMARNILTEKQVSSAVLVSNSSRLVSSWNHLLLIILLICLLI